VIDSDGNVYGPRAKLKPFKGVKGKYMQVAVGGKKHYLHRLLAENFLPNSEYKPDVAHIDGNGLNNSLSNLRWSTEVENMSDKKRHGTHVQGEKHGRSKLTDAEVFAIRYCRDSGSSVDELANVFGVSRWTIYDACNPKRRKLSDY
jgi:hypothetical protein